MEAVTEFLGESGAETSLRGVFDAEPSFLGLVPGGGPDDCDMRRRRVFCEHTTLPLGASGDGLNREGAGEHHPVEAAPLKERSVKRCVIFWSGKGDERKQNGNRAGAREFFDKLGALQRGAGDDDTFSAERG